VVYIIYTYISAFHYHGVQSAFINILVEKIPQVADGGVFPVFHCKALPSTPDVIPDNSIKALAVTHPVHDHTADLQDRHVSLLTVVPLPDDGTDPLQTWVGAV
jgi:hypothetical protein